jgi:hypothetical protein
MRRHYIIFHPEKQRQLIKVSATSMIGNSIIQNWSGNVFVDKIGVGNEDPFVFNNPWIYSFCHATQLRRKNDIQIGSWLIFACYQPGKLIFDTLFLIGDINTWSHQPVLQLPQKYQYLSSNRGNKLWKRHFKFPFQGQHTNVKYSYEANLWQQGAKEYSFLPYIIDGVRVSIEISEFSETIVTKINNKLFNKRPVDLNDQEINEILAKIDQLSVIKILRDIT